MNFFKNWEAREGSTERAASLTQDSSWEDQVKKESRGKRRRQKIPPADLKQIRKFKKSYPRSIMTVGRTLSMERSSVRGNNYEICRLGSDKSKPWWPNSAKTRKSKKSEFRLWKCKRV